MALRYEIDGAEHWLPSVANVCSTCYGRGKHDHPAFADGLTMEQLRSDQEFAESYFGGAYDVQCTSCDGRRVVMVLDRARVPQELLQRIDREDEEWHAHQAEVAAEKRAGA
jgi:hypothetical protein